MRYTDPNIAIFDKTYRFDGKEITAERRITILKENGSNEDWKSYKKFAKDTSLGSEPWIQPTAPAKPITIEVKEPAARKPSKVIAKDWISVIRAPTPGRSIVHRTVPSVLSRRVAIIIEHPQDRTNPHYWH